MGGTAKHGSSGMFSKGTNDVWGGSNDILGGVQTKTIPKVYYF